MSNTGTVKIFNPLKGFGFITSADGTDIFLHIKACNTTEDTGVPQQGDTVTFDMEESKLKPGQMQASNVSGGTAAPAKRGGGVHQGTCKSFVPDKGWGFITGPDGTDVFFHAKGITDGSTPDKGDLLNFDLEESKQKPGQMLAVNVTGGKGWGKGKGDDKGKGKGGYGAAKGGWDSWGGDGGWGGGKGWGGDAGWGSPYGKGKDGGKGKGKGGGWGGDGWGGDSWGGDSWGGKGKGKGGW